MCLFFLQGEVDSFPKENYRAIGNDQDLHGSGWEWDDASAGVLAAMIGNPAGVCEILKEKRNSAAPLRITFF